MLLNTQCNAAAIHPLASARSPLFIQFIRSFGDALDAVVGDLDDKAKETTVIADVHTDINTKKVLEEGTGYARLIVVAYKVPDGRIIAGAGPVLSYYEFKHPMSDRLTDEKWKEMLERSQKNRRGKTR